MIGQIDGSEGAVFFDAEGGAGLLRGQQDQEPRNGASPTSAWHPGDVIADDYLVYLQDDTSPGRYRIRVGLYLPLGGQRLVATSENGETLGDSVVVFEIDIPGG